MDIRKLINQRAIIICLLALIFLVVAVSASQAQIYKWTDGKGVVHYSNVPMDRNVEITAEVDKSPAPPSTKHYPSGGSRIDQALDAYRQERIEADIEDLKRKVKRTKPSTDLNDAMRSHHQKWSKKYGEKAREYKAKAKSTKNSSFKNPKRHDENVRFYEDLARDFEQKEKEREDKAVDYLINKN